MITEVKHPHDPAHAISEAVGLGSMTLWVNRSWGNSLSVCLSHDVPEKDVLDRRIAGAKASGGSVVNSWSVRPADLLQTLFTFDQLKKIEAALAEPTPTLQGEAEG